MEVSSAALLERPEAQKALKDGIAASLPGVTPDMVSISISTVGLRRLLSAPHGRRLAEKVLVKYRIMLPPSSDLHDADAVAEAIVNAPTRVAADVQVSLATVAIVADNVEASPPAVQSVTSGSPALVESPVDASSTSGPGILLICIGILLPVLLCSAFFCFALHRITKRSAKVGPTGHETPVVFRNGKSIEGAKVRSELPSCHRCKGEIEAHELFCSSCGAPAKEACSHCMAIMDAGECFCCQCGRPRGDSNKDTQSISSLLTSFASKDQMYLKAIPDWNNVSEIIC